MPPIAPALDWLLEMVLLVMTNGAPLVSIAAPAKVERLAKLPLMVVPMMVNSPPCDLIPPPLKAVLLSLISDSMIDSSAFNDPTPPPSILDSHPVTMDSMMVSRSLVKIQPPRLFSRSTALSETPFPPVKVIPEIEVPFDVEVVSSMVNTRLKPWASMVNNSAPGPVIMVEVLSISSPDSSSMVRGCEKLFHQTQYQE